MRDVASTAGVSLKTVSRVVNAEAGVSEETSRKVTAAIERVGFARNELARGLRHGRAGALGLVIEDVANPFYSALARAVEGFAHARGHLLLIGSCGEDPEREQDLVLRFLRQAVDAALVVPAGNDHRYLLSELGGRSSAPIIFLDRPPGGIELDTVLADNRGGARRAVDHMIRHGHRRIAVIADDEQVYTANERVAGAMEALADAGIEPDAELVVTGARDASRAEDATRRLMAMPAARRPTALFTANNRITLGALRATRGAEGMGLVGFDDFELADMLATPVTVVRQSPSEIARLATAAAYARLDGGDALPTHVVVPCELVVRGSGEVAPR